MCLVLVKSFCFTCVVFSLILFMQIFPLWKSAFCFPPMRQRCSTTINEALCAKYLDRWCSAAHASFAHLDHAACWPHTHSCKGPKGIQFNLHQDAGRRFEGEQMFAPALSGFRCHKSVCLSSVLYGATRRERRGIYRLLFCSQSHWFLFFVLISFV